MKLIAENGISIRKSTTCEKRKRILKKACCFIGKIVFVETFLFNYRGRLLSVNGDRSITLLILAADETFRTIRIDLPLIIEIGPIACKKHTKSDRKQCFSKVRLGAPKRQGITVCAVTPPRIQRKIRWMAPKLKGKVVIVKTLLYNYVVCVLDTNDSYIKVRQLVDFKPRFVIDFRISTDVILDIEEFPG